MLSAGGRSDLGNPGRVPVLDQLGNIKLRELPTGSCVSTDIPAALYTDFASRAFS